MEKGKEKGKEKPKERWKENSRKGKGGRLEGNINMAAILIQGGRNVGSREWE